MSNFIYGRLKYGRYRFVEAVKKSTDDGGGGGGGLPEDNIKYIPGQYQIIAYNKNGTKTAIFGAGSESNALAKLIFEMGETGCGKVEMTFNELPKNTELTYRQRIDIHLFGDSRPWYSGYIITTPETGTTATSYKITGFGFYNLLDKIRITKTYKNQEVSVIVRDIVAQIETKLGLPKNNNKIINTSYTVSELAFDHVTAKEALSQLADFGIDYVYGVDEYRNVYFCPRSGEVNEQARFWVGQHLGSYEPSTDVENLVNHAFIKGGNVDDNGEQWLAEVSDATSQSIYGLLEDVWSLPSAYASADAKRWGQSQLNKYKNPIKSCKISNVNIEYPKADGTYFVRKLATTGQSVITDLNGKSTTYPITKLKYTISATDGIKMDMELGQQPFAVDRYFANLDREAKIAELLQQAATKQLKTK